MRSYLLFSLLVSSMAFAVEEDMTQVQGFSARASLKEATLGARKLCSDRQKQLSGKHSRIDVLSAEREGNDMKVMAICFVTK